MDSKGIAMALLEGTPQDRSLPLHCPGSIGIDRLAFPGLVFT